MKKKRESASPQALYRSTYSNAFISIRAYAVQQQVISSCPGEPPVRGISFELPKVPDTPGSRSKSGIQSPATVTPGPVLVPVPDLCSRSPVRNPFPVPKPFAAPVSPPPRFDLSKLQSQRSSSNPAGSRTTVTMPD
jgi:hypothetical protein